MPAYLRRRAPELGGPSRTDSASSSGSQTPNSNCRFGDLPTRPVTGLVPAQESACAVYILRAPFLDTMEVCSRVLRRTDGPTEAGR